MALTYWQWAALGIVWVVTIKTLSPRGEERSVRSMRLGEAIRELGTSMAAYVLLGLMIGWLWRHG